MDWLQTGQYESFWSRKPFHWTWRLWSQIQSITIWKGSIQFSQLHINRLNSLGNTNLENSLKKQICYLDLLGYLLSDFFIFEWFSPLKRIQDKIWEHILNHSSQRIQPTHKGKSASYQFPFDSQTKEPLKLPVKARSMNWQWETN